MSELHPISKEDIYPLLERLRIELFRRSGWDKDGNPIHDEMYRHYNLPIFTSIENVFTGDKFNERTIREATELNGDIAIDTDIDKAGGEFLDLTIGEAIKLSQSEVINAFQGQSLINAIINICDVDDLRKVKEFDIIPGAFDKKTIEDFLSILEADKFDTKTPHCRSACTGLCMNACTDTCSGACVGECASCSTNCVGGCHTGCDGCSSTCGTSCGVGCGTGCAAQATGCNSCYSACSGCVSCTDTCTSGCTGCANQCSSCLAGCQGSSGYNNTCGCGNNCSTACGGKAASVANGVAAYSLTFYHDKRIYGIKRAVPDTGSIVMPSIVDYDNVFTPNTMSRQWMDEDSNTFSPGQTVRIASSTTVYNNLKKSGIAVTKSRKFKSMVPRAIAYLCPPISVVSPSPVQRSSLSKFTNGGSLILPYASTVIIKAKNFSGLSTDKIGAIVNTKYVALPYKYHHAKGTKITIIGDDTITVEYRPYPSISKDININTDMVSYFVPYAEACPLKGNFTPCDYTQNPHVNVYLDGMRTDHVSRGIFKKVRITAESLCDIHADGSYTGYQYSLTLNEYRYPSFPPSSGITVFGDTDSLHNAFVTNEPGSTKIKYKIPLVQEKNGTNSDMTMVWSCKVPSREVIGFDSSIECLMIPECDGRPMVKVPFNSELTVYARQDFYLFPYIP